MAATGTEAERGNRRPPGQQRSNRQLGLLALVLAAGWLLLGVMFVHSARPGGGALTFGMKRGWAVQFIPQWWAFFTGDPQKAQGLAFRRNDDNEWVTATAFPNGSVANFVGWRRKGRSQGWDLDKIIWAVPKDSWRKCAAATPRCLDETPAAVRVEIPGRPILCGPLGLMTIHPVRWEDARSSVGREAYAARVVVACRH